MGFLDKFKQRKEEEKGYAPQGKYSETCAMCGNGGTDKKWMGQYWHRKCLRLARKGARRMI